MNILGFDINISRASGQSAQAGNAATGVKKSLSVRPEAWLRGEDVGGGAMLSNAYEQVVWVYRAINVLAEQVANVPFLFSAGERGRENLISSGPLLDFYSHPHPHMNRFQYWELRVIWLMLRGECFRIPLYQDNSGRLSTFRERQSKIKRVLMLDPARFQHIIEDHQLIGWRYTGFGPQAPLASQVFLPEEVWFEKLPNPFDFWRGLSPLYVGSMAARTDFAASALMQGIIENNGDTGVIVRTDKWLSDEQQQQIIGALKDRKRRAGLADKPLLLLGTTEVLKPQLSSSDLQFLENRKFSRAEICAAFGVPEEIVTTTEHSKYDVMAGARLNFIENRVAPLCSRLEAEEDVVVKSIDPTASGWFDIDSLPIMQEARRNRLAAAKAGFDMGVPFNELNRVLDLGFKPLPWGDRGYLSTKLQEVTTDSPEATVHSPETTVHSLEVPIAGDPFARADGLLSCIERVTPTNGHQLLTNKLRRFFFEQRCRALANLPTWLAARKAGNPMPLLEVDGETAALLTMLRTALELKPAVNAHNENEPNPLVGDLILLHLQRLVPHLQQLNQSTAAALQETLDTGLAAAEPPEQLAARIKTVFNDITSNRSEELAKTELAALSNLNSNI